MHHKHKKRAAIYKSVQKRAFQVLLYHVYLSTCLSKNMQKHAFQSFLDPIQKRASSRSMQLETVQLKALL